MQAFGLGGVFALNLCAECLQAAWVWRGAQNLLQCAVFFYCDFAMDLDKLNQSLSRQDVQFDATGIVVAGQHYAYSDIQSVHYMKPGKRGAIRSGLFAATVALAAWVVLASQQQSQSAKLAMGLLLALIAVRLYLFAKVFSKLSLVLKNGEKILVTKKRDMIAADRIYAQLMQNKAD